ncbi:MAG: HPr(Ser) kinase/phosphatase [Elusimicrobia bacterium CG06_land_8_20_14_3_00_38_11]|nr:MAG: HPr(Ser) kinase/phosphatase [Elusimicrobia bacterium CG06_land_8_20_14_3_00_38_11]
MNKHITVRDLFEKKEKEFLLETVSGEEGFNKKITVSDTNRLGLALTGFFDYFPSQRVQILGLGEITYLKSHPVKNDVLEKLFSYDLPAVFITRNLNIPSDFLELSKKYKIPVMKTSLETGRFMTELTLFLEDMLAPSVVKHGVLVNVSGMGVLIFGHSSIGKSECALELIKSGHILVADDVVEIKRHPGEVLIGFGEELIRHHMEIRGIGIIDIRNLFGIFSVMDSTKIDLVVQLEQWKGEKEYDRLGLDDITTEILGVNIPTVTIPVRPGRNLSSIVAIAAMNQRLKMRGYHAAQDLNRRLIEMMKEKNTEQTQK